MTHGEKDVVLRVEAKAAGAAALAGQFVFRRHRKGFHINHGDLILVFEVNIKVPRAVALPLFWRAAEVNPADH